MPARTEAAEESLPARRDFWGKYGWHTTISVSVGVGSFGILQTLMGLVLLPTPPAVTILTYYVFYAAAPLLAIAGITAFLLPLQSLIKHHLFD